MTTDHVVSGTCKHSLNDPQYPTVCAAQATLIDTVPELSRTIG